MGNFLRSQVNYEFKRIAIDSRKGYESTKRIGKHNILIKEEK